MEDSSIRIILQLDGVKSGSLGWSLGVCISKKFPGDAAATDLGTMLENP